MTVRTLTKLKAVVEDLIIGIGTLSQTREAVVYTVTRIDLPALLNTVAALAALDMSDEDLYYSKAIVLGFATAGDGGGGTFWFDSTEAQTSANGTTIIAGSGVLIGCWKKIVPEQDTQTNFLDISADINTTNKYEGKEVWDTTNKKPLWAVGATAGAVWVDGTGATVHTPV